MRTNNKLNPHMMLRAGIEPGHIGGGECSYLIPAPPTCIFSLTFWKTQKFEADEIENFINVVRRHHLGICFHFETGDTEVLSLGLGVAGFTRQVAGHKQKKSLILVVFWYFSHSNLLK